MIAFCSAHEKNQLREATCEEVKRVVVRSGRLQVERRIKISTCRCFNDFNRSLVIGAGLVVIQMSHVSEVRFLVERDLGNPNPSRFTVLCIMILLLYYIFQGYPKCIHVNGFLIVLLYVCLGGLSELARGEWCLLWREWRARTSAFENLSHGHHPWILSEAIESTNVGVGFRNTQHRYVYMYPILRRRAALESSQHGRTSPSSRINE